MTDALLSVRALRCRFAERTVLDGIQLELAAGQRLCIAGRSGRGKSTLLRLIAGLQDADAGEIAINGRTAMQDGKQKLAPWDRELQLVFQDLGLWPTRSVQQHLLDALRAQGVRGAQAKQRTAEVLQALDLQDLAARRPGRLSGGEARRVALARALACQPKLLLLDEPFASLDAESRDDGFRFLESVLELSQAAVILVTHDPEEATRLGGTQLQLDAEGHLV
jgi:ABC-type sugar transport system ATPase subunit